MKSEWWMGRSGTRMRKVAEDRKEDEWIAMKERCLAHINHIPLAHDAHSLVYYLREVVMKPNPLQGYVMVPLAMRRSPSYLVWERETQWRNHKRNKQRKGTASNRTRLILSLTRCLLVLTRPLISGSGLG